MNKPRVLFDLKEALEELQRTVKRLEKDRSYNTEDFRVAIGHLYHHLNTAWNARDCTDDEFRENSDKNFKKWRKFPKVSDVYLK